MLRLSHSTPLHKQQTHSGRRLHSPSKQAGQPGCFAAFGRYRSRPGAQNKVPSLRRVVSRTYLHDGSVASLEEMFDPDRIKDTHAPGGWSPPGTKTRAIKGHEFGLKLTPLEREQLLAFLRTL